MTDWSVIIKRQYGAWAHIGVTTVPGGFLGRRGLPLISRHGRACPGHPRLRRGCSKGADARHPSPPRRGMTKSNLESDVRLAVKLQPIDDLVDHLALGAHG